MRDTKFYYKTANTVKWLDNKFDLESIQNSTTTSSGFSPEAAARRDPHGFFFNSKPWGQPRKKLR